MWYFRYHGDERLLPEYNPSMSDNVMVVEDAQNTEKTPESSSSRDYFEEQPFIVDSNSATAGKSLYLATLKLNKVRPEQKGIYKCGPSNTKSASVELHITDGT